MSIWNQSRTLRDPLNDPDLQPALKVLAEHDQAVKGALDKVREEIDERHAEIGRLQKEQDAAVKKMREFEVEVRAYARLHSALRAPTLY